MDTASDYLNEAEECRSLALRLQRADDRDRLLKMAAIWERLADEAQAQDGELRTQPKSYPDGFDDRR